MELKLGTRWYTRWRNRFNRTLMELKRVTLQEGTYTEGVLIVPLWN